MLVQKKQVWYENQEEAASPAVTPVEKTNVHFRSKCFVLIVALTIMAMIVTVQSAAIVQSGYDVVKIKSQITLMEKNNELLRLEIAKLKSPQRIEQIASREMGMIVPQNAYYASVASVDVNAAKQLEPVATHDTSIAEKMFSLLKANRAEASKGR
ncbi:MAG TPA: cell division protein FtsL [Methylomusa anaerophila]|uniref:Cell division protein FtsL n=1 Tax=Methylomusa anaerophila TaxID=1930071 RepID=A0A348AQC0_9FIRM|nr:cell division protein FtsL [Methylomusa anaerophila]BBB93268.1 cell division protein FtsL [Methylomusa anaerophila]HML86900.1 cell division protein FtsL [Methylomusa anaerophila]